MKLSEKVILQFNEGKLYFSNAHRSRLLCGEN